MIIYKLINNSTYLHGKKLWFNFYYGNSWATLMLTWQFNTSQLMLMWQQMQKCHVASVLTMMLAMGGCL